ncbi:MAG: flagellar biosynthesis protein FlgA, partial [Cellulomonadaceae bacterium]|nr:flagellar biosynthesis protein FlgA [Cellulomonadaceae bacterium]
MPSAPIALRVLAWRLRPWLWTAFVVLAAWMLVQRVTSPPVGLPVVVTAHAVPPGEVLEAGDLRVASVPRSLVPDGVVTDPSALV